MTSNYDLLISKLDQFTRKFYLNKLIRGVLYFLGLAIALFLLVNLLEHYFYFTTTVRKVLFYGGIAAIAVAGFFWVLKPLMHYFKLGKVISHEQASSIIGEHFTDVKDKLLNILQLRNNNPYGSKELIEASISQKIDGIKLVPFRQAINLGQNKRYIKYAVVPLFLFLAVAYIFPNLISGSTERLINNDVEYARAAPFAFSIEDKKMEVVQYEDYLLDINVAGIQLPDEAFIHINNFPYKLKKVSANQFAYKFNKVQKDTEFFFESGGIKSENFVLNIIPKPSIIDFSAFLDYPSYLGKKDEQTNNTGDMVVPAGTKIRWDFQAENTDALDIRFEKGDTLIPTTRSGKTDFTYSRRMYRDNRYTIYVSNDRLVKADSISYMIGVKPDLYPSISVQEFRDSTDNKSLYFLGDASDDYGVKNINFVYEVKGDDTQAGTRGSALVEQDLNKVAAKYSYTWDLIELGLQPGAKLTYFFEVWDNDGVSGSKVSRSQVMAYELPTVDEMKEEVEIGKEELKDELQAALDETKELQEELKEVQEKMIDKEEMSWQDKEQVQKMIDKHKNLQEKLENSQEKMQQNMMKQDEFQEFSEQTQEKREQLQKLMDELLTDEMKEMLKKMEELLEEASDEEMMEELEDMEMTEEQLEKELDRMMELMKQLEFEEKIEETIQELEELAEEQKDLGEQTENDESGDLEEEKKEQEEISEEFEEIKEDLEELEEMNEELGNKDDGLQESQEEAEEVSEEQEESMEQMEEQENQKAGQSQKKAGEKMQKMAESMKAMQQQMQQEQQGEDMQAIRQLLENLIAMSLDQERVMDEFKGTSVNNPGYVPLVQEQYKLKDDFQIVQDSLVALSKRVFQIESFLLKELGEINQNINSSIDSFEDRKIGPATVNQQYVMTSLNNVALMLSETLEQMQQQMEQGMPGNGMCNKPGGTGSGMSGLKKMQQKLNESIEKMLGEKGGGKKPGAKPGEKGGGGGMSKELAKAAQQQAAIRDAIRKMNQEQNKDGKGDLGDLEKLMQEMEETETDLVNRKITAELLKRQNEIMVKLLEAEKAERERGFEEKREAETAREKVRNIPPEIEEYLKKRNAEVELYRTVPPELQPYYRALVQKYFESINF